MKRAKDKLKNGTVLELVIADVFNEKIYATEDTYKRSMIFGSAAAELLNRFRARYPSFQVEANDEMIFRITLMTSTI